MPAPIQVSVAPGSSGGGRGDPGQGKDRTGGKLAEVTHIVPYANPPFMHKLGKIHIDAVHILCFIRHHNIEKDALVLIYFYECHFSILSDVI